MADHVQQFKQLAGELERLELPAHVTAATAAPPNICAIWKTVKPFVSTGIKLLKLLPFPWAQKLATALEVLEKALDALCP